MICEQCKRYGLESRPLAMGTNGQVETRCDGGHIFWIDPSVAVLAPKGRFTPAVGLVFWLKRNYGRLLYVAFCGSTFLQGLWIGAHVSGPFCYVLGIVVGGCVALLRYGERP